MKRLLIILFAIFSVSGFTARAEEPDYDEVSDYATYRGNWPDFTGSYDAAACARVKNPKAACNRGGEALLSFVANFNSSKSFRNKRMRGIPEYLRSFLTQPWWATGKLLRLAPARPVKSNKYFMDTWQHVDANSAWYISGYMPPFDDDDTGLSLFLHFECIGGKWYLTQGEVI